MIDTILYRTCSKEDRGHIGRSVGHITLVFCALALPAQAVPNHEVKQKFVKVTLPPKPNPAGAIAFPEPGHEYMAPGPNDIRGPCPGLNTLANHGYLPRGGVVSFEEMVTGVSRVYNMEYTLVTGIVGFVMLARGNAYINKISIGQATPLVPALPGGIDGTIAGGLAKHARVEGDISLTRQDADIGNQKDFNATLFHSFLDVIAQKGGDHPLYGPKSIVNHESFSAFKKQRFTEAQHDNPKLVFHAGRLLLSFWETSFVLNMFANGTTGLATVPIVKSFFQNQTFPPNWHRRDGAASFEIIAKDADIVRFGAPVLPGVNGPDGKYVLDPLPLNNCSIYTDFIQNNLPAVILQTKGDLKKNVDLLLNRLHLTFPNCPVVYPSGPANI